MAGIVLFLVLHLALVALVPRTLPAMITGAPHPRPMRGGQKRRTRQPLAEIRPDLRRSSAANCCAAACRSAR